MPLPSSGIIVVEKPSSASGTRINNSTTTINTVNSSIHPPQERTAQQTQIQYYEYYDVNDNLSQQYQHQQQQQHSTIVVDGTIYHQQQQHLQLGGSSGVAVGRKIHNSSSTSSTSSSTSSSSLCSSSSPSTLLGKKNLHLQTLKTVPMPQNKQYSQQQQIIQHTSHSITATTTTASNPQHHLHQQPQHVQQINLAASSLHHQTQHHHQQQSQQPTPTTHMIQVSEEFLEQAANNHNTGNMMISTTGEVLNQQQIFKIVSTDGTTGNMIIDATNQNVNSTTTTASKVLLSNLTVLSKQQTAAQGQLITTNHQQPQTAAGQTINFVNAKNLYTTSATGGNIAGGGKQQKFTVATANVGSYKSSAIKQTSSSNSQYLPQANAIGQQKINMTAGNRNVQMLTTRIQSAAGSNNSVNVNTNSVAVISNNTAAAQTVVLQQPQKFIANNTVAGKMTTSTLGSSGGNLIKKSTTGGTLRMNNSNNTAATTKLMNNLQTTQGVKTFITQTPSVQQQQSQQNMNQLTLQHHTTKSSSKSKFVKQYNNAILNSAGAVAIATLPHQQSNSQNSLQQIQQPQTTYINHHKISGSGSNKINKINSKYAQSANVAAHLPPGTQLHQKSINQTHQFQTANTNSNIKFVNAQGTVIQQQQQPQQHQSLTPQKINNKHHHHQQQHYQNLQNFDTVDGNHLYNQTTLNQSVVAGINSSISPTSGTTTLSSAITSSPTSSSLLTDDIMMVNGTQMTDELSARILQSMSQKSFGNQRYQHQQHVYQTKSSITPVSTASSSNSNNNNCSMLPPPPNTLQNTLMQTSSNNNNSNILLSPREYTLYPATAAASTVAVQSAIQSSSNHYNNSSNSTATASLNLTAGSFTSNNYITVSNNSNNMTTITPHTPGTSAANGLLSSNNTCSGANNTVRQAQSAPGSRSQSMERKLHESLMSRKSTEYYKVNIKDYNSGCAFVVPSTATIYATNTSSPSATSLIDFIIPLPSCTTITTTNNITTSTTTKTNCATMTTIITNSSNNLNQINNNSNHNSLRGSSHHNNLANATVASVTQTSGSLTTSCNMSASVTNLMGGVVSTPTPPSPSPLSMPRSTSIPTAALIMEPQAQVIHLQATKTLPGANNSSNDDDDDIIGEEVRPAPVETEDIRLRILHAVLFDHTYVNPMPLELPTSFAVQLPPALNSNVAPATTSTIGTAQSHGQQWSLGGIGAIAAAGTSGLAQQNYAQYGTQLSRLHQDDDSYSAISTSSRLVVGDIDPGEETETAPEGELEDDSITRCICDLTHDDGYMICCDKCCAWQHVDCMGIDRQNIPDEYLCELCQPRTVDKARARSLQLMKRKEQQQQQLILTAQAQAAASSAGTMGAAGSASGGSVGSVANMLPNDVLGGQQRLAASNGAGFNLSSNMTTDSVALQLLAAGGSNLKKNKMLKKVKDGMSGKRSKKAEKLVAAAGLTTSGKPARKETKKNTKRKKAGAHESGGSTVGMTAAEKHAANLRQWIENYELAVTNHYSPELRARLHAITKQPSLLQSILNTENIILKEFSNGSLENRATTVPHAGGKILISNLDIIPNSPICELRGKYMLTTQYKTQNTSMNMNSPPPNNYHLASYKAHKTPGPFIFFYQLPGSEVAASGQLFPQTTSTTTLNPDGTYTTTTTTLPAQLSPPTLLRGPEICVDTRTYGNEARFVRRSCRPNAEIQHLFEKGTIHLFIVALTDIRASTEITIRHEPHDLLAVENKRSSSMIIQPTSTPCACGLTKDCIFGPPLPQLPPAAKSNAGRKSLTYCGGTSGNAGNLTAKQRKANQQILNRNRSISSSASGDSNMGTIAVPATANTIAIGLNSPNNINKGPVANRIANNNTLMPLTASCNSNLSNASSSSSALTSIMHDSGVCTSSSSPSVSIPSPTQLMHSPIQQQQHSQQLLHNTQMRSTVQLLPQQQQHQLMQSLPTPLVLTSTEMPRQPQQQQQQNQEKTVIQQPAMIIHPQQQLSLNVISQTAKALNTASDIHVATEQQQPQTAICLPNPSLTQQQPTLHTQTQQHQLQQQLVQMQTPQNPNSSVVAVSVGLLETVSPEATIAAVALQTLNSSHSPNVSGAAQSPSCAANIDSQLQPQQVQQQQFVLVPTDEVSAEQQQLNPTSDNLLASTSETSSLTSSPQQQQQQQQQQHKSPQKNNHSHNNNTHIVRKTPGKHCRTTSFSEENDHHNHNEDNSVTSTPTSTSTPKEKPKLSREDRKMEAILKAIEKMERNQQRKQEQKQTKRQNAGSQNTTPTSPNKAFDSNENTGGAKRPNSQAGSAGRSKKKRKAGAKGQGSAYNNQRKRRQSRMNSQESVDGCSPQDHDAITSESDGCAPMHSPPVQTLASLRQPQFSTPTSSSVSGGITSAARLSNDTITNNVDQAAGLLMAFANPNISPAINTSSTEIGDQQTQQSPNRTPSQYMISQSERAASPPPTPPSQVSSACLLIEAAVGPLESNLDANNADTHSLEFKYPLQAKTKKHLMNSWLHQTEETSPDSNGMTPLSEQTLQTPVNSVDCSGVTGVSAVTGGLDSLLQAAMNDLNQSQSQVEQPQNLSIVAKKVEEFIQQTEASVSAPPTQTQTKHSYEFEQLQQVQRTFANLPTPAVDLTLKTPLTLGPNPSTEVTSSHKNFHLPLQVSTCSNNSSVKKRWLRQAISEETHEEFQQTFSMTPSPTTVLNNNTMLNSQLPTGATCSSATIPNHVPNGFTTPLKKRRLLLTGRDEMDENLSQSCGDLSANATPSPPPAQTPQQSQQHNQIQYNNFTQSQTVSREIHEDVDVDVEKCEIQETQGHPLQEQNPKPQLQEDVQYSKMEVDQDQDVDVTTSPNEEVTILKDQIKTKTVIKYENEVLYNEIKEENRKISVQQSEQTGPAEFNDQEDDVDILRSPSPGREMIKAEDNLVKIEPEDISGTEDVKIDVEREESMAADDDVVTLHKEKKKEPTPLVIKEDEQNYKTAMKENLEIKKEVNLEMAREDDTDQKQNIIREIVAVKTKADSNVDFEVKIEEEEPHVEIQEPKPKRLKLEKLEGLEEQILVCIKKEQTKQKAAPSNDEINLKQEVQIKTEVHKKLCQPLETIPHSSTKESAMNVKTESFIIEENIMSGDIAEVTSSTLLVLKDVASDTAFSEVDAATPPPPPATAIVGGTAAPIQRHKSLSDDDIQARLHSFHKENILFLQSRNKKSKSSSSITPNTNSNSSSNNCLTNSNDHHKNRTSSSSSSSSNHQHHYNHHHHHYDGKEKSEKSSSKHHKNLSTTPSSSSKKQKMHKRERKTSSSSTNSHQNTTIPQISSSSSLNKTAVINATTSSGSSKKLKALKKSSSGSSTSSSTSSSSNTSTLSLQNSSNSSALVTIPCLNSEKERVEKDKHQRQRTSSTSSSSNIAGISISHTNLTTPQPSSKKRQLNFELELTKDMHLLNSAMTGGSKHKRLASDEQAVKKSRKESTSSQREELKNCTTRPAKIEKAQDKKFSSASIASTSTKQSAGLTSTTSSQQVITPTTNDTSLLTQTEEPKLIPTIVSQPPQSSIPPTSTCREHPTLPHFNNVISTSTSLAIQQPPLPPVQLQPSPPVLPQNIPNHLHSPSFQQSFHSNHNPQQQQTSLPPTPPSAGGLSSPSSTLNVNSTSHLPFYNTIYGKLLDNSTPPPSLPTVLTPLNTTTPPPSSVTSNASVSSVGGVLSEYLDTKLKSYNSLGGYVSHTALFGLNNAAVIKDSSSSTPAAVSSTTISGTATVMDSCTEMPAPLPPPPNLSSSTTLPASPCSSVSAASSTPLKIHTKTASHDPRLNPQLTAPEPPPQPKRKLSINEYRKRMLQSSSNDSNSGSSSLATTPTTPLTPLETASSLLAPTSMPLTNKCTLNSPDRLTLSVDSQIQKEIMSSTSVGTSSSSLDSLNSSNSSPNSTSLNDTLLKSSSLVEEDSTKGQFNAAPTLLEKQQESLCARLKSLKEKQSLGTSFSVGSGNRLCFTSFSEGVASHEFCLRKDDDDMDIKRNRNLSISSSIGGGDLLDNCLEEISSTSTSMSSSREPSPERCFTTHHHKILTASATTTMANTSAASHSNNGQTTRHHQQHHHQHPQQHISCDKSEMASLERNKSVDIA